MLASGNPGRRDWIENVQSFAHDVILTFRQMILRLMLADLKALAGGLESRYDGTPPFDFCGHE
jgi:hypothetical protein